MIQLCSNGLHHSQPCLDKNLRNDMGILPIIDESVDYPSNQLTTDYSQEESYGQAGIAFFLTPNRLNYLDCEVEKLNM